MYPFFQLKSNFYGFYVRCQINIIRNSLYYLLKAYFLVISKYSEFIYYRGNRDYIPHHNGLKDVSPITIPVNHLKINDEALILMSE